MAHTFTEAVHLSTIHMIYGADHAVQEAAKENAADNRANHTAEKSTGPIAVHLVQQTISISFFKAYRDTQHSLFILQKIPSPLLLLTTPPPDFLG